MLLYSFISTDCRLTQRFPPFQDQSILIFGEHDHA